MRVIRSAGQNVSPSDDGRLFNQAFSDGLFEDATIAANGGNNISIGALYGIICGRDFTAEAQTISAVLPDSDTATGYVYVEFDTSAEDIITIGTALAPFTPTYEDINTNGAVVQMIIAEYEASAVAVTTVTPIYSKAGVGTVQAGSIATVESQQATENHAVGDYVLLNGQLYAVTAAVSVGETFVVGSNIEAASVGDELTELKNGLMLESNTALVSTISANTATVVVKIENVPKGNYVVSAYVRFSTTGTSGIIYARVNDSNTIVGSLYATDQYANYAAVIPVSSDNATVDIVVQISTARTLLATRINLAKI